MTDTVAEERLRFFTMARSVTYEWAKKHDPMAVRAFEVRAWNCRKVRLDRLAAISHVGGEDGHEEIRR
jgi:hypothetical protein